MRARQIGIVWAMFQRRRGLWIGREQKRFLGLWLEPVDARRSAGSVRPGISWLRKHYHDKVKR